MIPTVAPYLLPTILEAFATDFPALVPEVTEAMTRTLLAALESGSLDLLVMALPSGRVDTVELPLYWEEFVLLVPDEHRLAGGRGLPTTTLQGLDVLLLEEGHCMRDQTLDVCRQAGAAIGQAVKMASLTTVSQLVAAGLGVTLLPASAVPVEVRGRLATAHFADSPLPGRHVGMVHRRSSARAVEYSELAETLRKAITGGGLPVVIERTGSDRARTRRLTPRLLRGETGLRRSPAARIGVAAGATPIRHLLRRRYRPIAIALVVPPKLRAVPKL